MVTKNKKKTYSKRKKYVRKSKKSSKRYHKAGRVSTYGVPLPQRCFTKLKYHYFASPTPASPIVQIFRGNSLFDPDFTNTGHQPLYFDQLAGLYEKYRVRGLKLVVDVSSESSSAAGNLIMFIYPKNDTTTTYGFSQLMEMPGIKKIRISPLNAGGRGVGKAYVSTKGALGLNKITLMDDDYSALVTGNPTTQWYLHCILFSTDGTTSCDISWNFTLTYYCEFFDRVEVAQS